MASLYEPLVESCPVRLEQHLRPRCRPQSTTPAALAEGIAVVDAVRCGGAGGASFALRAFGAGAGALLALATLRCRTRLRRLRRRLRRSHRRLRLGRLSLCRLRSRICLIHLLRPRLAAFAAASLRPAPFRLSGLCLASARRRLSLCSLRSRLLPRGLRFHLIELPPQLGGRAPPPRHPGAAAAAAAAALLQAGGAGGSEEAAAPAEAAVAGASGGGCASVDSRWWRQDSAIDCARRFSGGGPRYFLYEFAADTFSTHTHPGGSRSSVDLLARSRHLRRRRRRAADEQPAAVVDRVGLRAAPPPPPPRAPPPPPPPPSPPRSPPPPRAPPGPPRRRRRAPRGRAARRLVLEARRVPADDLAGEAREPRPALVPAHTRPPAWSVRRRRRCRRLRRRRRQAPVPGNDDDASGGAGCGGGAVRRAPPRPPRGPMPAPPCAANVLLEGPQAARHRRFCHQEAVHAEPSFTETKCSRPRICSDSSAGDRSW